MRKNSLYNDELWANLEEAKFDFWQRHVHFYLPKGECVDMNGAISVAKKMMPNVQIIWTYAGNEMDTIYWIKNGEWVVGSLLKDLLHEIS
jgi:hypothetical protein